MRIRTRSLIILATTGVTQSMTILTGIVLVRMIDQVTFGTYRQALLAVAMISGLLSLQLGNSLYYYIPHLDRLRHRSLLLQTLTLSLLTAVLPALGLYFGADTVAALFDNPAVAPLLRILAIYPFLDRITVLLPSFLISYDRATRAGIYSMVTALGRSAAIVGTLAAGYGLDSVAWGLVVVAFVLAAVGILDMVRLCPTGDWGVDTKLLLDQINYTWPLWATAGVGVLNLQFDKALVSGTFSPDVYAVYSVGAVQLPMVALITSSLASATMPNMVRSAEAGDRRAVLSVWHQTARKASLVIFPVFSFFVFMASDFVVALYGEDYSDAMWPFMIYLAVLPIRVSVYSAVLRAFGNTRPIATAAVFGLVVNVVASSLLVWWGRGSMVSFVGPSVGTVLATLAMAAYQLRRIGQLTEVSIRKVMRWSELFKVMAVSAAVAVSVFGLTRVPLLLNWEIPAWAGFLSGALVYAIALPSVYWWGRMLSKDEIELVHGVWNAARRFVKQAA